MKKLLLVCLVLLGTLLSLPAQGGRVLEAITWPLDSLLPAFHYPPGDPARFDSVALNKYKYPWDSVPVFPPNVIAQRLKDLGSPIRFDYNSEVQAYITMYTQQRREQVRRMLGLKEIYFPIFEDELARNGMPIELRYLPVIESALNPHARSRVGATGLWQFMLPTGKLYGLDVTSYIDERRDPFKSTEAACRYLREMYRTYGDWLLVIAAYNCGPGNVNKAIRLSGGKRTFWEISDHLPRETRGYVPAFIAANYVFAYATEHNLYPRPIDFSFYQDTLHFRRENINLLQIAHATATDFYQLKDLNPELLTQTVPYLPESYVLRVPNQTAELFALYRDSVMKVLAAVQQDSLQPRYDLSPISPISRNNYGDAPENVSHPTEKGPSDKVLVYYKVRSGDVVSKIADKYNVTPAQIKSWNHLRGYSIKAGQTLKLYVTENTAKRTSSKYVVEKNNTPAEKPATPAEKPQETSPQAANNAQPAQPAEAGGKFHKVAPGDTLWTIAQKYEGMTVDKLKSMNNLKTSTLHVGQVLRIQ